MLKIFINWFTMHNKRASFEQFFNNIITFPLHDLISMWGTFRNDGLTSILSINELVKNMNPLLLITNSFIVIVDLSTFKSLYVSPSIKQVIGYQPSDYSIPFLIKNFCPADSENNTKFISLINTNQTVEDISERSSNQYVTSYRFYHKDQYYVWLENRMIFLAYNQNGKPAITFTIISKIDHIKANDNLSYTRLKLNPKSLKYSIEDYLEFPPEGTELFDETGLAIVKGLINGLDNREIAKSLGISEHTLSDYRKRLLKKTWCENTCELVHFAIRNKLV
jgi:DNA-binding CsgD family transcriptional regulator